MLATAAVEMLFGGVLLLLAALARGEWRMLALSSNPATPEISPSPSPINSQPSAFAISRSFIVKLQVTVLAAARGLIVVR